MAVGLGVWAEAVGTGLGCGDSGRPMGWLSPGWTCSVDGTMSGILVVKGLAGSVAVLAFTGALLGLKTFWVCTGWETPVLFTAFVTAGVCRASWDPEEAGALEVTLGEAADLEGELVGNSWLRKGWRGVVLTGKERSPVAVTAWVMSGK